MVISCSAYGCTNRQKKKNDNEYHIQFHRIPLNKPDLLRKWMTAIRRKNWVPTRFSYVCSEHFTKNCYIESKPGLPRRLKRSAVPTVFCFNSISKDEFPEDKAAESPILETFQSRNNSDVVTGNLMFLMCRLCAKPSIELSNLFENEKEKDHIQIIQMHLPVIITPEDVLPTCICAECIEAIELIHDFYLGCIEADTKLKRILGFSCFDAGTNDTELVNEAVKDEECSPQLSESCFNLDLMKTRCRTCAQQSSELLSVFSKNGIQLDLLNKIHVHLPIMVTYEDILPTNICFTCVNKLEGCHNLYNGCIEADSRLRKISDVTTSQETSDASSSKELFFRRKSVLRIKGKRNLDTQVAMTLKNIVPI